MPVRTHLALLLAFVPFAALAVPPEVPSLLAPSPSQLTWEAVAGATGYHLYRGSLSSLGSGQYGTCLLGSVPSTSAAVPDNPAVGQGYFFLVGAFDETGTGPIGFSSSGVESFPEAACKPSRRNFPLFAEPSTDGLGSSEPTRNPSREKPGVLATTFHRVNLHSGEVVIEEKGHAIGWFRSVSGLKSETEVVDYQEGGIAGKTHKLPGRFDGKYLVASCTHKFYRSAIQYDGPLGHGWDFPGNSRLGRAGPDMILYTGDGRAFRMRQTAPIQWEAPEALYARLFSEADGSFLLRFEDGWIRRYHGFDGSNREGALAADEAPDGERVSYLYDHQGLLITIVDQLGRSHTYEYDAGGRVVREADFDGRETIATYDAAGDRTAVRSPVVTGTPNGNDFPAGKTTRYAYSGGSSIASLNHNLLSIQTPGQSAASPPVTRFEYGTLPGLPSFDRVVTQVHGDPNALPIPIGGTISYAYQHLNAGADPNDPVVPRRHTAIIDRNGNIEERTHNAAGQPLTIVERTNRDLRPGEPDYVTQHLYNADGQLLQTTSPQGTRYTFLWDAMADLPQRGNLLELRLVADPHAAGGRGDGHGGEVADIVWSFTYEPLYNQLLSIRNPRGNVTSFQHDYQEGDPAVTGLQQMADRFGIDLSTVPLALGDLNGDGRLNQIVGRCVCRRDPDVLLDPASMQAAIEGDTTQEILTCYVYNDHGQLVETIDPERNRHSIAYHPESDPDGDGIPTPPPADGRTLSTSEGGYPHTFVWDYSADPGRNNGTNPPPVSARVDLSYDARGNVTRLLDPRGVALEWTYNQLDQVVEERRATATYPETGRGEPGLTPFGFRRRYEYDADDNLVRVQQEDVGETRGAGPWIDRSFVYDPLDNPIADIREMTTGHDVEYRFAYDANENRVLETTPEGIEYVLEWDERDLLLGSIAGASGPRGGLPVARSYSYDGNGNLTRIVDGRGGLVDHEYDGFDRRTRTIDQAGGTVDSFYDPAGNVTRILKRGPAGGPTPSDRSGATNVDLEETVYAVGELERITRAYTRLFVPSGASSVRPPLLLEGALSPGDGGINRWIEYDKLARVTFDHADSGAVTRYDYDGLGRLVRTTHPEGSTLDLAWDPAGNLVEEVETELSSTRALPFERFFTTHHYDALGRGILTFDSVGHGARRLYDSLDGIVATSDAKGPLGPAMPRRSALGTGLSVPVNEHGNVTRYTYDGLGRLGSREQVLSFGGQGDGTITPPPVPTPANPAGTIRNLWAWGPDSLVREAHDGAGNTTTYTYDNAGRLSQRREDDGTTTSYDYDGEGNLVELLAPDGTTLEVSDDSLHRRVRVAIATPTGEGTTVQTYEYDGLSRLTRATDDNQPATTADDMTVTFLYDSLGRRLEETAGAAGGTAPGTASMGWLAEDQPARLVYSSGRTIEYGYDAAERLRSITDPSSGGGSATYQYFGLTRAHTRLLGNGARSTVLDDSGASDIGFDGARRITLLRHLDSSGALLAGLEFRYDRGNNRTSQRRPHHPGGGQSAMGELYLYDSADRLTGFQERMLTADHLPAAPSVDSQSWGLDAAGNWATFSRRGVSYLNTPNNNNEYDEPQSGGTRVDDGIPDDFGDAAATSVPDGVNMAHDLRGNRIEDGVRYVYDGLSRLIRAETAAGAPLAVYAYDALGRRAKRDLYSGGVLNQSTLLRYWGDAELDESDAATGLPLHETVHGHGGGGGGGCGGVDGAWKVIAGGALRYLLEDPLGSSVAVLEGTAPAVQERVTYDPYGKPTFESAANAPLTDAVGDPVSIGPSGNLRLFGGMRYDPETGSRSRVPAADRGGLYRTWHRGYSPNEGRFLTRDPLGAWADPFAGGNAYAYAGGNPINWTDPTGLGTLAKLTIKPEMGETVEVMFNPKEYTITKATPWKHHDIQGLDAPTLEFTSGDPCRGFNNPQTETNRVYQHNQTDLEFVRTRASRPGYEVQVEDGLKSFSPRMSTADQVTEVIVRGWDPKQKKPIIGTIVPPAAPSGKDVAIEYFGQQSNPFPFTKN